MLVLLPLLASLSVTRMNRDDVGIDDDGEGNGTFVLVTNDAAG